MARARNIKPGFFSNDMLVELPFEYRLLFAGLWTIADRAGRLEDRPKKIKMDIFPGDNVDCDKGLDALANSGFVKRYIVEDKKYIQIIMWDKHQNPHIKEAASTIPAPCENSACTVQAPGDTQPLPEPAGLIPDSLNLIPDSLNLDSGAPACDQQADTPKTKKTELVSAKQAIEEMPELDEQVVSDFLAVRKAKRAPLTRTAWNSIKDEILITQQRFGIPPNKALSIAVQRGWQGLEADWIGKHLGLTANESHQRNSRQTITDPSTPGWADDPEFQRECEEAFERGRAGNQSV